MQDLYNNILRLMCMVCHAMNNAMILCQSWVYNGHKRKYRYFGILIKHYQQKLETEMFDDHALIAPFVKHTSSPYHVTTMQEHAQKWYETMKDACEKVAKLNVELIQLTGKQSCWVKKFLKILYYEKQKAWRWIKRGEATGWYEHDLRRQDDVMHEKYKCKEKRLYKGMK